MDKRYTNVGRLRIRKCKPGRPKIRWTDKFKFAAAGEGSWETKNRSQWSRHKTFLKPNLQTPQTKAETGCTSIYCRKRQNNQTEAKVCYKCQCQSSGNCSLRGKTHEVFLVSPGGCRPHVISQVYLFMYLFIYIRRKVPQLNSAPFTETYIDLQSN